MPPSFQIQNRQEQKYCDKELSTALLCTRDLEDSRESKDKQESDPTACNWELTFHGTKLPRGAFRTFMRLVGTLKQDLNASAHTERLLPCSSANLVSFCWLLFHVWPGPNSLQIHCFLCFHIKSCLHTCYSYKPVALLFSNLARICQVD